MDVFSIDFYSFQIIISQLNIGDIIKCLKVSKKFREYMLIIRKKPLERNIFKLLIEELYLEILILSVDLCTYEDENIENIYNRDGFNVRIHHVSITYNYKQFSINVVGFKNGNKINNDYHFIITKYQLMIVMFLNGNYDNFTKNKLL